MEGFFYFHYLPAGTKRLLSNYLFEVNYLVKLFIPLIILLILISPARAQGLINIDADEIEYNMEEGTFTATTGVSMAYDGLKISSDYLEADTGQGIILARGNITFSKDGQTLTGQFLKYNTETGMGTIDQVSMDVDAINLSAASLQLEGNIFVMDSPKITTCQEEVPHYYLTASRLNIGQGNNLTAHSVKVVFRGVPIFYFPYLHIPLDERGRILTLLQMGHSRDKGFYLGIPLMFSLGTLALEYGTISGVSGNFTAPIGKSQLIVGADPHGRQVNFCTNYEGIDIHAHISQNMKGVFPALNLSHSVNNLNLSGGIRVMERQTHAPYISLSYFPFDIVLQRVITEEDTYWRTEARTEKRYDLALKNGEIRGKMGINAGLYSWGTFFASISPSLDFTYHLSSGIKLHGGYEGIIPLKKDPSHTFSLGMSVDIIPGNTITIEKINNDLRYEFLHETDCYNLNLRWNPSKGEFNIQARILGL